MSVRPQQTEVSRGNPEGAWRAKDRQMQRGRPRQPDTDKRQIPETEVETKNKHTETKKGWSRETSKVPGRKNQANSGKRLRHPRSLGVLLWLVKRL